MKIRVFLSLFAVMLVFSSVFFVSPSIAQECSEGEKRPCGSNIGECIQGARYCINGEWGSCEGSSGPFTEVCNDNLDNDCDALTDEQNCISESGESCSDILIPEEGCICQGHTYTYGYCYDDFYQLRPKNPEIPFIWLSFLGLMILVLVIWDLKRKKKNKSRKKEVIRDLLKPVGGK